MYSGDKIIMLDYRVPLNAKRFNEIMQYQKINYTYLVAMLKVKLDMQETNGTYVGSVSE